LVGQRKVWLLAASSGFLRVLIAICQGRQRRDAVAARKEQLERFKIRKSDHYGLYLSITKATLVAMYL
jgi:hypothetical protein